MTMTRKVIDPNIFEHELVETVKIFGRDSKLQVVLKAEMGGSTNHETVTLQNWRRDVPLPLAKANMLRMIKMHEIGHVLFTNKDKKKIKAYRDLIEGWGDYGHLVWNGIEDPRMERDVFRLYAGAAKVFEDGTREFMGESWDDDGSAIGFLAKIKGHHNEYAGWNSWANLPWLLALAGRESLGWCKVGSEILDLFAERGVISGIARSAVADIGELRWGRKGSIDAANLALKLLKSLPVRDEDEDEREGEGDYGTGGEKIEIGTEGDDEKGEVIEGGHGETETGEKEEESDEGKRDDGDTVSDGGDDGEEEVGSGGQSGDTTDEDSGEGKSGEVKENGAGGAGEQSEEGAEFTELPPGLSAEELMDGEKVDADLSVALGSSRVSGEGSYQAMDTSQDKVHTAKDEDGLYGAMTYGTRLRKSVYGDRKYMEIKSQLGGYVGVVMRRMENAMASLDARKYMGGFDEGKLNGKALVSVVSRLEMRAYKKRTDDVEVNTAVEILIDLSGSMHDGGKSELAMQCAITLCEALERTPASYEVTGFNAVSGQKSGKVSRGSKRVSEGRMLSERTGDGAVRADILDHWVFKDFDSQLRDSMSGLAHIEDAVGGQNIDGESVGWAAARLMARKERRKILLVLSDGNPAGFVVGSRDAFYAHLKDSVSGIEKSGVSIAAIGIMSPSVERFYKNWVVVNDIKGLSGVAMEQLSKMMFAEKWKGK